LFLDVCLGSEIRIQHNAHDMIVKLLRHSSSEQKSIFKKYVPKLLQLLVGADLVARKNALSALAMLSSEKVAKRRKKERRKKDEERKTERITGSSLVLFFLFQIQRTRWKRLLLRR
jgi:hypothetical protein